MAIETVCDHTCNIFHLRREGKTPGFGLQAAPEFK